MRYAPYELAERLEDHFGDPHDAGRVFSLPRCAELDRREEFPAEICRALDAAGVAGYYVPARHGGSARTFEETLQAVRMLARRDLTVAIAHGKTFLGAVSAWVAGTPGQARGLAAEIVSGGVVSWGLSERAHGSDLLAGDVTADAATEVAGAAATGAGPGGYRLSGEKWLINNATRADLICVLARTDAGGGPRGFSLLLVDKRRLDPGGFTCLPAVRTHGVRGADISGIAFHGADVPAGALIGAPGFGLEIVLKGLQLTRTLCAALSLGAADRALRLALPFALEHELYGRRLVDLPQAARTLTECYADLLAVEALALVGARSIHALPGELSVTSAVVKYLVPTHVDEMITRLGQLLGARAFLAETYAGGLFQKVERDHRIVGIFDGNTLVNLNALVDQFPRLVRSFGRDETDETGAAGLAGAATLAGPPPEFDPARLSLVSRRGSSVVRSLRASRAELGALARRGTVPDSLAARADELLGIAVALHARMAEARPAARDVPAASFRLAARYAHLFAAAACARLWLANHEHVTGGGSTGDRGGGTGGLWSDGLWLEACLARLLDRLRPRPPRDEPVVDRLLPHLVAQYRGGLLFSPLACRLPEDRP